MYRVFGCLHLVELFQTRYEQTENFNFVILARRVASLGSRRVDFISLPSPSKNPRQLSCRGPG